ncbi:hypothetical protein ZYZZX_65 [Hafnia phage vB_HpaM_Zyzzx]|uniref:Uncharacterized protein n=1 Tax=Hafnia phage vB_HpaM_Zyzzx TaxID=2836109 RepID=A0AAE7W9X3_9CAUD|nr:hypothetical protein ZYZZX_65 [Hafnia phage vB_HpaM_Zyzzx]
MLHLVTGMMFGFVASVTTIDGETFLLNEQYETQSKCIEETVSLVMDLENDNEVKNVNVIMACEELNQD